MQTPAHFRDTGGLTEAELDAQIAGNLWRRRPASPRPRWLPQPPAQAQPQVHPTLAHLLRCMAAIGVAMVLLAVVGALAGCGGGDAPPDEAPPPHPCQQRPELCK